MTQPSSDDGPHSPAADPWSIDLASPDAVIGALDAGTRANLNARCRRGAIDHVEVQPGVAHAHAPHLVATGDLHDNPLHLRRVCELAGLTPTDPDGGNAAPPTARPTGPHHLTLHELIHGERLMQGMDMSYRVLARAAALKAQWPEHVHTLLANHELAQIVGAGVIKNGVNCVKAFDAGVEYVFGELATDVTAAINRFIESMPLALRVRTGDGRVIVCAHSIPSPDAVREGFDFSLLDRALASSDLTPRTGSAHMMVWGRGYEDPGFLRSVSERLGADLLLLGHELAESGARVVEPCAVVLNSDHSRGAAVVVNLAIAPTPEWVVAAATPLAPQS